MSLSFADTVYMPGISAPVAILRIDEEEFELPVPPVQVLLDIAVRYAWRQLIPDSLVRPDRERMYDRLADPDDLMTLKRLHVVAQPLGLYLYGFPFFTACRALGTLRHYFTSFRMWAVCNLAIDLSKASAADWCAAAVTWMVQSGEKEEKRREIWAHLTVPGVLPMEAPGVSPDWMV